MERPLPWHQPDDTDADWHKVRVVHQPAGGEIAGYVDRHKDPLLTAEDAVASGRAGRGWFDNVGRARSR